MNAVSPSSTTIACVKKLIAGMQGQPVRTIQQFAEDEIVLPDDGGPFAGEEFDIARQPYLALLWHEIQFGAWSEIFICGPSQSGKTFGAFVVPIAYIVGELRKNLVVGVPIGEIIDDKWKVDIRPVFEASPFLKPLLPVKGPGSENGRVKDSVQLTNGVLIKFMTKGGSDVSKAAFTSPKIVVTEAAAWSQGVSTSKESDPLAQLRARQKSKSRFTDDLEIDTERQMIVEGTVTNEDDLPWRMKERSSDSRIVTRCPHCKAWIEPDREHLGGFEDCKTELEAAAAGRFFCSECGEEIGEADRLKMNQGCKLVHKGQTINKRGTITGPLPPTATLFFRWSAFHNQFLKIADLAADEWKGQQLEEDTQAKDDNERELLQTTWARPHSLKLLEAKALDPKLVEKQQDKNWSIGVVPADTHYLTFGVDIGRYKIDYFALALRHNGTLHCPVYGTETTYLDKSMDVQTLESHEDNAIVDALGRTLDLISQGWSMPGGELKTADLIYVDARYASEAVFKLIKDRGGGRVNSKLFGIQGVGQSIFNGRRYVGPKRKTKKSLVRKVGHRYHIEYSKKHRQRFVVIDVDYSKAQVQKCLRVTPGQPGALTLCRAPEQMHRQVAKQLSAEWYKRFKCPTTGKTKEQFVTSGQNHKLDCAGYGFIAGQELGWRIPNTAVEHQSKNLVSVPDWLKDVR